MATPIMLYHEVINVRAKSSIGDVWRDLWRIKKACLTRPSIYFIAFLLKCIFDIIYAFYITVKRDEPSNVWVKTDDSRGEKVDRRAGGAQLEKRRRKLFFFAIRTSRRKAKFEAWPTSLRCLLKWQTRPQNLIKLVNPSAPSSTSTTVVASPSTYLLRSARYKRRLGQSECRTHHAYYARGTSMTDTCTLHWKKI